jgi:hypothetical protein
MAATTSSPHTTVFLAGNPRQIRLSDFGDLDRPAVHVATRGARHGRLPRREDRAFADIPPGDDGVVVGGPVLPEAGQEPRIGVEAVGNLTIPPLYGRLAERDAARAAQLGPLAVTVDHIVQHPERDVRRL